MTRRPTRSTRTDPLFPCPTLFRSEIERVILPEVIFVFGQVEGRGELDRAFGALLMALRLELVAGIFARGRHAGEAGDPAGAAEAELDHRLELVVVDPADPAAISARLDRRLEADVDRSEEHTSELQSLMRISSSVFRLKTKITL